MSRGNKGDCYMKTISLAAVAAIAFATATPATAAQRFEFQYGCTSSPSIPLPALRGASVASVASCASVKGSFDLDHSGNTLAAGDYFTTFDKGVSKGPISNVNAVVSGASVGNGNFGPADFGMVTFNTTRDLDLTRELVGQGDFGMNKFGDDDFNVFAASGSAAPSGSLFNYEAQTNGGFGDPVKLTSLQASPAAAVPEPATWAMMIMGMGMVGAALRRRRSAPTGRAIA